MKLTRYVLASDLGSGSCKTILLDEQGRVVAGANCEYPTYHPQPGWVEQKPDDWYKSFTTTVQEVLSFSGIKPEAIQAIGLVGVTHNTVLLDREDRPLGNTILTFDQRSVDQCSQIKEQWGDEVFRKTLNAPSPLWSWPQLLWIRQNNPGRWEKTKHLLFQKDYVRHRLAPAHVSDTIDAAGSLLFDPVKNRWIIEFCNDLGVGTTALPEIFNSMEVVSRVNRQGALDSGLKEGTPVIAGTTDTVAEVFGSGLLRIGQGMVKLASVGRLAVVSELPLTDPHILNYRHVVPDLWYPGSGTKSAATCPRWLRDNLWRHRSYSEIDVAAAQLPPGSEGLLFHPHLHGEWAPHWNEELRANFIGATARHTWAHFSRAVLEGVAFSLRHAIEYLSGIGLDYTEYRLIGGETQSSLWCKIVCDILGQPLTIPRNRDAVYGAALITAIAAGLLEFDCKQIAVMIPVEAELKPDLTNHTRYSELFEIYKQADQALMPVASQLAKFEQKKPAPGG